MIYRNPSEHNAPMSLRPFPAPRISTNALFDKLVPPRAIPGLTIRDARGARRITQKNLLGALRIPRGGPHRAELVAAYRHYDGATNEGKGAGYYANIFVAWRVGTTTWRSGGVRILPFEAERIARAIERGTGTQPGSEEPERISGGVAGTTSQLLAKAFEGGAVHLYVRFEGQGGSYYRTRGVEILRHERAAIAEGLRMFAAQRSKGR
jgi:hypothetical protein